MLEELSVRNFALIENLALTFEKGLTILTGETGAGKSIIVGSLSFLLGAKADSSFIRTGCEEAVVSAVIFMGKNNDAVNWLKGRDIKAEDERVIVRRSIKTNGRSSIYVQNIPVSRSELSDFMSILFDIHGQHEHESLLRRESHRQYLDRYAMLETEAIEFNKIFLGLADKRKTLENSVSSEKERDARIGLLSFCIDEIEKASIKSGEIRALEAESARLSSFEKLTGFVTTGAASFCEDDVSALSMVRKTRASFENAASIDAGIEEISRRITNLFYEAEDITGEIRGYLAALSFDPARLEIVQERLALLYRLKKKYADPNKTAGMLIEEEGEEAILAYRTAAIAEIEALNSSAEDREHLQNEIKTLEKEIALRAARLTEKREKAGLKLSGVVRGILKNLGMAGAAFSVSIAPKGPIQGGSAQLTCGPWGADEIEFMLSANTGEPPRELARIASGGELSRVMLAIKTALIADSAEHQSADTLIFDEIDTGIGGEVALAVGEYLWKIGGIKQIFCVTHLASIASRADNHLRVEKITDGKRTTIILKNLCRIEEKKSEIARMLSGDKGKTALAHAGELLEKYGGRRNG
ncbi:DNA repair protein RecN [Spirochaetia bacterium]|nr:DNA repair protein RecN [Spirochaetia bacterium]